MPITQHEQLTLHPRSSNELLATIPIKKRHFLFTRPTSPPQDLPTANDHVVSENKNELLEPESSYADTEGKFKGTLQKEDCGTQGNQPDTTIISKPQENSVDLASHVTHCEFSAVVDGHMNEKCKNLESGSILQINSDTGKHASNGTSKESIVEESRDLNMALELNAPFTVNEEGFTNKLVAKSEDGISCVQETVLKNNCSRTASSSKIQEFELQGKFSTDGISMVEKECSDKMKEDSNHISLSRLNWDLNTPMDAWEYTMESSLRNNVVENKHHVGVKFDSLEVGIKQILGDEPNKTDRKNLLSSRNTVNSDSEACLDLQLKPFSNSCSTLRKLNVSSEMSFLTLGTNPMPYTSKPRLNTATVVKSEPDKRHQMDTVEGQVQNLKTPHLNQVKTEAVILDNLNLASSKLTMKFKPLNEIRLTNKLTCETSGEISNSTAQPNISHTCINSSKLNLPNSTSGTVSNVQLFDDQPLIDAKRSDLIPKSLTPDKGDTHSTSEACEKSNLPSPEISQAINSNLIAQHSSNSTLTDDVYKKMSEDSKVAESDEVDYKEVIEELCDTTTCNSGSSQVNAGFERCDNNNEDNMTAEVSCKETRLQPKPKTSNSLSSTDCPKEPNSVDGSKGENSSSSVGKTRNLVSRPVNDISNEGKGKERNLRTNHTSSRAISSDNLIDKKNTAELVSDKEVTLKEGNDRASQRIIYLNTALEKRRYTSDYPFSRETNKPGGKSFRTETFYEKSRKVENERRYGHRIENSRFDIPHGNARAEQINTLIPMKQSRKQDFDDERQNLSRFPYQIQRRSPTSHHHSARDISPKGRLARREAHDFAQLSHEESQYERVRERTSFSPPLRRGRPQHFPPRRTITQWSPPRRSSNEFNGHRELVRSRSPPHVRTPFYQQERSGRRIDAVPPREDNYSRSMRVSNDKNIRRFHNIADPREIGEEDNEEYFDNSREFDSDEKFIDDRRCDERRGGPIQESIRYHDEDGTNPRDFDSRFRYRLGNSGGGFGGFADDQEDGYRALEEQEWRDSRASYSDNKIKRRRF